MIQKLSISLRKWRSLLVIVLAAVMLEGISAVQYMLTRRQMEGELEKRAESELMLKAVIIKSHFNEAEDLMSNLTWKIIAHLDQPDSAYLTMRRFVRLNSHIKGAGVGFVPNYYPQKGRLYEIYATRNDSGAVETRQIAGQSHDYTQYNFYKQALESHNGAWVEPYYDHEGAAAYVTSYVHSIHDRKGQTVGFAAVDVDLKWLSDTINSRHIYPSSFILVQTESAKYVIHPDTAQIDFQVQEHIYSLINDSTVARRKSSSGHSTVVNFDTSERDGTIFYANMRGKPHWQIAVVCYDDEVYAPLSRLRLWLLGLMVAAFAILFYVVWRFARNEQTMNSTSQLLEEKTREQERMDVELHIANGIQQALLPQEEPSLIGVNEVEVNGRLIPAKAVGGDLYNVFVRNGKLFFCIGDVSGKGVPAAIIMAVTQTLFRHIAEREDNPARIMEHMNETACRNNPHNIFVTMFIGVLDLPTGHLRYCNAGHEVPYIINEKLKMKNEEFAAATKTSEDRTAAANSSFFILHSSFQDIPIGLFSDFKYQMQTVTMLPGQMLFLYTDGLTEARNGSRAFFGHETLDKLMARCTGMSPKELTDKVIDEVQQFAGNTEQSDDLTLLALRYTPPEGALTLDEQLTLSNDVKEVAQLGSFVKDIMTRLGIGKPLAPKLRLALEEAVVNVMEYAYPAGARGDVNVRAKYDGERLQLVITDSGIAFNPTEAASANTTLSAEERPVGGLGILLMRELMDFINYERIDGCNILTMTKRIKV